MTGLGFLEILSIMDGNCLNYLVQIRSSHAGKCQQCHIWGGTIIQWQETDIFEKNYYCMCMGLLLACVFVYHEHIVPRRPEVGFGFPETVVKNSCELPCRRWESNSHPLEEEQSSFPLSHVSSPMKLPNGNFIFNRFFLSFL